MKLEKAKELFRKRIEVEEYSGMTTNTLKEAMKTVLNELEKKDKVIDEMAEYIVELIEYNNFEEKRNIEEIKEYFYKKVSDNK